MIEYHKIQSIFKRDEKTHKFIVNQFSLPEFEYLKDNIWVWTEKIDGTNIRVSWDCLAREIKFGGRTDNAQIPAILVNKLQEIFTTEKFKTLYPKVSMILFGEGFGARIQKGGGNYIPDNVDFVLFDVMIDDWWLKRENIEDIAQKLEINVVPIVGEGGLYDAVGLIMAKIQKSHWGNFLVEGLVLRPKVELKDRGGKRIVTKLKHKDF